MTTVNKKARFALLCLFYFFISLLFFISVIGDELRQWYDITFHIPFETLLYTMAVPLKGMDNNIFALALSYLLPSIIFCLAVLTFTVLFDTMAMQRVNITISLSIKGHKAVILKHRVLYRCLLLAVCPCMLFQTLCRINASLQFTEYVEKLKKTPETDFYEKHYVRPRDTNILVRTKDGKPKNILLIYMESMETTYAAKEDGGRQDTSLLPCLTRLQKDNISFCSSSLGGGLHNTRGTTWTIGSIFSSSCGVPFSFPIEGSSMNIISRFASGITAIGDILESNEYTQEFLCGSDADFGGRKDFFLQHGGYNIFDYYSAIEKGYIDKGYFVWWGFEDAILYKIAKDELISLSKDKKPFNLTMLTVDTHHIGGYVCSLCENNFTEPLANVIYCADKQLGGFIDWCKEQDFFKDTVIIITGDHPRMDDILVKDTPYFDRTVYNCFINAYTDRDNSTINTKNRTATTVDLFPTILYAAGFSIEGERLGLGTNLFSDVPTLTEELGFDYVNEELSYRSNFYMKEFY